MQLRNAHLSAALTEASIALAALSGHPAFASSSSSSAAAASHHAYSALPTSQPVAAVPAAAAAALAKPSQALKALARQALAPLFRALRWALAGPLMCFHSEQTYSEQTPEKVKGSNASPLKPPSSRLFRSLPLQRLALGLALEDALREALGGGSC